MYTSPPPAFAASTPACTVRFGRSRVPGFWSVPSGLTQIALFGSSSTNTFIVVGGLLDDPSLTTTSKTSVVTSLGALNEGEGPLSAPILGPALCAQVYVSAFPSGSLAFAASVTAAPRATCSSGAGASVGG
jgi:hypothetical protein